jgi:hypothetical protein
MAPLTQKQIDEEERLLRTIENAVSVAISKTQPFPFCVAEKQYNDEVREAIIAIKKLLVGNGNPQEGLVWKAQQNAMAISSLREEMLTKKDLEAKKDPFIIFVKFAVDKILPPLITTGIIAFITFLIAVNNNLILVKGP